jgi:transcription elongation GreA/GreB family factor
MSKSEVQALKQALLRICTDYVQKRISHIREVLNQASEDAQTDQKSSMGDKYETSRAMLHLTQENASVQLREATKLQLLLTRIDPDLDALSNANVGSLVMTERHRFFIAISIGEAIVSDQTFLIVSPDSPIGKSLMTKRAGDHFQFQGREETILQIR